jgi:hypothetical protein
MEESQMRRGELDAARIRETVRLLDLRIGDRFPGSGLSGVCRRLHEIAEDAERTQAWIERPMYALRGAVGVAVLLLAAGLVLSMSQIDLRGGATSVTDFVQATEAGLNEMVLIGAGVVFLVSMETRAKRRRVTRAVNSLRSLAHIIDAHQLTKDPDTLAAVSQPTSHSPKRGLSAFELGRYLDYCAEMLSLTGKLGFLYVQRFDDPVANSVANDLEALTDGLSRKIWQKIMILRGAGGAYGGEQSR